MNTATMTEHTKRKILTWLIVVTMAPLPFLVKVPTWGLAASVWLYVSAVLGYVGLVMLLWMYILGTKSVMGLYFNDLAPVLSIHKWLGKWGVGLIFFHPVATAISYGDNVLTYSFSPNLSQSFERSVTWGRFALYALLIVWVTSALVRGRIAFRPWKYIHYLAYIALPLALVHVPSIGTSYRSLNAPRIYFMSVFALLIVFSILRLRHLFSLGRARFTVVRHSQISPGVWMIALKPNAYKLTIRQGQYVYMQWSLLGEEHPFTVLQTNEQTGELTIAYKVKGAWTKKMTTLRDGDMLYLDGPYGDFMKQFSPGMAKPTVFIAAGIGITPFISPLLAQARFSAEHWLFYANQRPETATFATQLADKMGSRYVSIFSRADTPPSPGDERGHINAELLARYLTHPRSYEYYICGSEGFMKTVTKSLETLNIPAVNIHAEAFGW